MIVRTEGPEPTTATVGFIVEAEETRGSVAVVGDFNDWDPARHPLHPGADGRLHATLVLTTGRRYAFRYLAQDGAWFDEPDADEHADDGEGHHNCVLDLRTGP